MILNNQTLIGCFNGLPSEAAKASVNATTGPNKPSLECLCLRIFKEGAMTQGCQLSTAKTILVQIDSTVIGSRIFSLDGYKKCLSTIFDRDRHLNVFNQLLRRKLN